MDTADRQQTLARVLKRYEITSHLASGGMADIYLARATGIGGFAKTVVIKAIRPELSADEGYVQMFLDEARIAATLNHANIVHVYDADAVDGTLFLVMEHLQGRDLAQVIAALRARGQRVPLDGALAVLMGLAAGLHHAHKQLGPSGEPLGIVHRDVTPSNVFLTFDGSVKVIDFGIAKARDRLTKTDFGMIKGKAAYLSPEQLRCEPLDARSDLFSLAVVAYELTTGHRPFEGDNQFQLQTAILESEVKPPSAHDPDYPPELAQIVLRGLARERAARHGSAESLRAKLEAFARGRALDVSPFALARLMAELFPDEAALEPPPTSVAPQRNEAPPASLSEGPNTLVEQAAMTLRASEPTAATATLASARIDADAPSSHAPRAPDTRLVRMTAVLALVVAAVALGTVFLREQPQGAAIAPRTVSGPTIEPRASGSETAIAIDTAAPAATLAAPPTVVVPARVAASGVPAPSRPPVVRSAAPRPTPSASAARVPDPDSPLPY